MHKNMYIIFQISFYFNSKKSKITYVTSRDKYINKLKTLYLMEYYQAVKGKEQKLILSISCCWVISHVWLCNPMDRSMSGSSILYYLPEEFAGFVSIKSVMLSNHLILCCLLLFLPSVFPSIRVFSNELAFCIKWSQRIGASASASVLLVNIQDWFPLGLTGLISWLSKGLSRVFSSIIKNNLIRMLHSWMRCLKLKEV